MNSAPELWLIAGPNGAGKTTVTRKLKNQAPELEKAFGVVTMLNPDDRALAILKSQGYPSFDSPPPDVLRAAFLEAAEETEQLLSEFTQTQQSVGVETVLSSGKFRNLVESVVAAGGRVSLIYVALSSPDLAVLRVSHRVHLHGHDVPVDKIRKRWRLSLDELPWFIRRVTRAWIFDNSENVPVLVATIHKGKMLRLRTTFAELDEALERGIGQAEF